MDFKERKRNGNVARILSSKDGFSFLITNYICMNLVLPRSKSVSVLLSHIFSVLTVKKWNKGGCGRWAGREGDGDHPGRTNDALPR